MIPSSSVIILEMVMPESVSIDKLSNTMKKLEDGSFLSLLFFDDSKTNGELHWSSSYENGKMNMLNFKREENIFFLFTSSPQNYNYLQSALTLMMNTDIKLAFLKPPVGLKSLDFKLNEIVKIDFDPYFGISINAIINSHFVFLKLYTNGLITYTMTTEKNTLDKILSLSLELVRQSNAKN